jgi:branched-chain amino acid transport system substrate-binding protein
MPNEPRWSLATIVNEPSTWTLAAKGVLNGVVAMGGLDPANKQTQALDAILKKHYGANYQMSVFDANAWDAVQIMKDAMLKAGSNNPIAVNNALQSPHKVLAAFGQPGYELTYNKQKHSGANGLCGLVLEQFTANNTPSKAFAGYQPTCS